MNTKCFQGGALVYVFISNVTLQNFTKKGALHTFFEVKYHDEIQHSAFPCPVGRMFLIYFVRPRNAVVLAASLPRSASPSHPPWKSIKFHLQHVIIHFYKQIIIWPIYCYGDICRINSYVAYDWIIQVYIYTGNKLRFKYDLMFIALADNI